MKKNESPNITPYDKLEGTSFDAKGTGDDYNPYNDIGSERSRAYFKEQKAFYELESTKRVMSEMLKEGTFENVVYKWHLEQLKKQ